MKLGSYFGAICGLRPITSLTPRSSGAPTAGHQARSGGTRYIFASPGLASCRRRPLSSNVKPTLRPTVSYGLRVCPNCTDNSRIEYLCLRGDRKWPPELTRSTLNLYSHGGHAWRASCVSCLFWQYAVVEAAATLRLQSRPLNSVTTRACPGRNAAVAMLGSYAESHAITLVPVADSTASRANTLPELRSA